MAKRKITIKDISEHCGVSKTTVSFILNDRAKENRISEAVITKVLKYIEETGYKPSQLATSFRTGVTKTIGLMVENISDTFFSLVAAGIEKLAYKAGYKIIYSSHFNNPAKAKDILQMYIDQHIDGFIITPTEKLEEDIKNLVDEKVPFVLFDRYYEGINTNCVVINNFDATNEATNHFITNGYDNIAFVTINSIQNQMKERLNGYHKAISDAGKNACVLKIDFNKPSEDNIDKIKKFLISNDHIDGILFATNYLALRGLAAISQLHKTIPSDYGVIAFDDHEIFELNLPSITAVKQPIQEMSKQIMNNLINQIESNNNLVYSHTVVPATLIVRNSTVKTT
ncbi:LacI family transcriptional regulator [Pedobacter frigiditerrae]|uniref:LacI family transcriptional regulator n=1 Tax=Pedobacter frigiditerrae TaxID=2530452 RepID=A0A4R0MRG1_9SPHI|nr:LacI family DNA-binding transcriptional regulator [Pedobacter frigiditerrae]TCC88624.1 LacI family transcriptional regulator [Pedobacter frigiditerrae]